jgi:hypothetical protein
MSRILLSTLLLLAGGVALADDEVAPKPPFRLELKPSKATYAFGQIPQLDLRWVNQSGKPQQVVRPCDGSQDGARFPEYRWTFQRVDGAKITRQQLGRCGNVNSLKADDFVVVAPTSEHPIKVAANNAWLSLPGDGLTWLTPGKYRATLTYSFQPKQLERCYGRMNGDCPPDIAKRIRATPARTVKSNTVEFEIAQPTPAEAKRHQAFQGVKQGWTVKEVKEALGGPDAKASRYGELTLTYELGDLFLEVHFDKQGKASGTGVRDWR